MASKGASDTKGVEQVSLTFLVENAYNTFSNTLKSTSAKVLMLGGFDTKENAVRAYLLAIGKKHLTDQRKKIVDPADQSFLDSVGRYAMDTKDYVQWVREEGGVPVWQEAVVTYCSAFENCLKAIAIAFLLAERNKTAGLSAQIYVPGPDLRFARKEIRKAWESSFSDEIPKVQNFFHNYVCAKNPEASRYELPPQVTAEEWENCAAAFQIRNAIVHDLGRLSQSLSIGAESFHANWLADISATTVTVIKRTFLKIMYPFEPDEFGFL